MDLLAIIGLIFVIYSLIYMIYPWFIDSDIKLALYERFGKPVSSLQGKVVWITGASSGIGEHLAYVLAKAGCKLILSARRLEELERVKTACLKQNACLENSDVEVYGLDICQLDEHETALNHIINKFGKLDILVNNAGRSQRAKWEEINLAVDKEMFHLNVFSQISLSRLVAKYFLKRGHGHIVVTSSVAGIMPVPFSATYCATKHALQGYYGSLLIEKKNKQIPITMVCPGPVQSNLLSECFTEKPNEKFGDKAEISIKKVTGERCGELMAIAMANELREVWIAKPIVIQLCYLVHYYPNLGPWIITQILGSRYLQRLRDDKITVQE